MHGHGVRTHELGQIFRNVVGRSGTNVSTDPLTMRSYELARNLSVLALSTPAMSPQNVVTLLALPAASLASSAAIIAGATSTAVTDVASTASQREHKLDTCPC